jgi:acyl-CoA synthetase (AMP-forming)/AMP-acid ligase II
MVLYESDLSTPIADITDSLLATSPNLQFVRWIDSFSKPTEKLDGITNSFTLNEEVLAEMSTKRIDDSRRNGVGWQSPACLIYTSGELALFAFSAFSAFSFSLTYLAGTTGLPKAAIVTHGRSATAFKVHPLSLAAPSLMPS